MSRANPTGTVDVRLYTVERNGNFSTFASAAGAVGAACLAHPDLRPPSWTDDTNPHPYARRVIVNGCVTVSEHKF
jgi:hypothetical protein